MSATTQKQKEERNNRLDKKRKDMEVKEKEKADIELAAESLLMLMNAETRKDASTQTEACPMLPKSTQTEKVQSVLLSTQTSSDSSVPVQSVFVPLYMYMPSSPVTPIDVIKHDDEATKFFTGLPSWSAFEFVLCTCEDPIPSKLLKLTQANSLLMTFMRLRLNLTLTDLAYRFHVANTTAGDIFAEWIDKLFSCLKSLIKWPPQDIIRKNLPSIFADLYPRTRCIIDCSEVFIERPNGYVARAQTYSNYKKHNTIKFLIGVTPCGAICFLSKCWGGRASDRCITMNSGFLDLLSNGDTILADRGFTIADDIALHGATLEIPSFTSGKSQLSLEEVEYSKRLSKVRIHVERVIGLLKNKYTVLQYKLPITILKRKDDDAEVAFIDKILSVCCSLCNLSAGIV